MTKTVDLGRIGKRTGWAAEQALIEAGILDPTPEGSLPTRVVAREHDGGVNLFVDVPDNVSVADVKKAAKGATDRPTRPPSERDQLIDAIAAEAGIDADKIRARITQDERG